MTDHTLPDRLRGLCESLVGDEWEHPVDAVETCRKAAEEIERLRDALTTLRGIIAEKLHLRRYRDCGCEFYATNGAVPYHDCPRCESRHTRRIASRKDAT